MVRCDRSPATRWSPSTAITLSLTLILRANATIRNVVLTGVATDVCVGTTARGAFMRDYYAVMVDDGTATFSPEDHASTLRNFDRYFGEASTMAEISALWR